MPWPGSVAQLCDCQIPTAFKVENSQIGSEHPFSSGCDSVVGPIRVCKTKRIVGATDNQRIDVDLVARDERTHEIVCGSDLER